jgi:hypothetical protein
MMKTNCPRSLRSPITAGQSTPISQAMPITLNSRSAATWTSSSPQPVHVSVDHSHGAVFVFIFGVCMLAVAIFCVASITDPTRGGVLGCLGAFYLALGGYLVIYSTRSPQARSVVANAHAGFVKVDYRYLRGVLTREAATSDVVAVNWMVFNEGSESDVRFLRVKLHDAATFDFAVARTDAQKLAAAVGVPLEERAETRAWVDTAGECPSWSKAQSTLGMNCK